MWKSRIACFIGICTIIWTSTIIFPMHSWKSEKVFLPALAFLGVVHTIRIMEFKSSGDSNFHKRRLAFAFGATDGALVILCLILALCIAKLAPTRAKQFEPVVF